MEKYNKNCFKKKYSHTLVLVVIRPHQTWYSSHFDEKKNVSALGASLKLVTLARICMSHNTALKEEMLHHSVLISLVLVRSSRTNSPRMPSTPVLYRGCCETLQAGPALHSLSTVLRGWLAIGSRPCTVAVAGWGGVQASQAPFFRTSNLACRILPFSSPSF